jgi:hypothetical protein
MACKGVRLTAAQIESVASGGLVTWKKDAPTYSLKRGTRFIHRDIKMLNWKDDMKNNFQKPKQKLGDKYQLKGYIATDSMRRIAEERTRDLLGYFHATRRNRSWSQTDNDLRLLCESCYMQGLHDILDVISKRGIGAV